MRILLNRHLFKRNYERRCVGPENICTTPPQKGLEIPGQEGGVSETQKFKAMYEPELEFPGGWWGFREDAFHSWDIDIFWNYTFT